MALSKDFKVKHGLVVSTTATILSTVTSTSTTSGALTVAGGVGIEKDLWVGGSIYSNGARISVSWLVKTANYTAVAGDKILADTSAGAFTITLPATPAAGTLIEIADGADWSINNLTVARNGSTIEGSSEDVGFNIKGASVKLIYDGSTWEVFASFITYPVISNDTSTTSTRYVTFVDTTSGALTSTFVSSSKLTFNPSTGHLAAVNFNSLSDARYKDNVKTLENSITLLNNINPVEFTWKDNGTISYGVIAQELEKVLPATVSTDADGIKTVSYDQLIPFLISAVQDLQRQIDNLRTYNDNTAN